MRKITILGMALSIALTFAPFVGAQSANPQPQEGLVIGNLCDPDSSTELNDQYAATTNPLKLSDDQLHKARVELLERGFNPGFDQERPGAHDRELAQAVAEFQSDNNLGVTGQIDAATLDALNLPVQTSDNASR